MEIFRKKGSAQEKGLQELLEKVPRGGVAVELGSAYGESALIFAKHFDTVHCVDVWNGMTENREQEFNKNTKGIPNIKKIKDNTYNSLIHFEDGSLDFVYIDANHSYGYVSEDIKNWSKKIKKGGYIAGHDYTYKFIGVVKAVEELLEHPDYVFRDGSFLKQIV